MNEQVERCPACQIGEKGVMGFREEVKCLTGVETMMICGCGGYVNHSVLRCTRCERYFLCSFEEHWPPHSEDRYTHEIDRTEAEEIVGMLRQCPDIDDRTCGCLTHRNSEFLHRDTKGERRYFEATPQSWGSPPSPDHRGSSDSNKRSRWIWVSAGFIVVVLLFFSFIWLWYLCCSPLDAR